MKQGSRVPESEHLLAEYMRAAGYRTAGFVDNEYLHPKHGLAQGFEYFRALANSRGQSLRESLQWLDRQGSKPFFLFVHTNDVHGPYRPRPPFTELFDHDRHIRQDDQIPVCASPQPHVFGALPRYQLQGGEQRLSFYEARYDAAIRQTDFWFERLLRKLRAHPDWEHTLVLFSADHGESFGNHGLYLNHGLVYEDIIRVPLLVRLPRSANGGTRIPSQVSLVDLLPTLLKLVGEKPRRPLAGRSLLPVLRGERTKQAAHVFASQGIFEQLMVRTDRYKLLQLRPGSAEQRQAWLTFPRRPRPGRTEVVHELYDLTADPNEQHNLAAEHPAEVARLRSVLQRWIARGPDYESEAFELTSAHEERLRALGYVE